VPSDSFPFACLSWLESQDANNEHRRSWFARNENDGEVTREGCQDDERSKLRVAQGWHQLGPRGRGRHQFCATP